MLLYANEQVAGRLGALAFEVRNASQAMNADAIHDLRVAIRRFGQSLRVFATLLPAKEVKKIRKRLNSVMDTAGQIRDRDIAIEFLDGAGVAKADPLRARLVSERKLSERALLHKVTRWNRADFSAKWRAGLRLNLP